MTPKQRAEEAAWKIFPGYADVSFSAAIIERALLAQQAEHEAEAQALFVLPRIDWVQCALHGREPCFHVEGTKFCCRAKDWAGHGDFHEFVSIAQYIAKARNAARAEKAEAELRDLRITVATTEQERNGLRERLEAEIQRLSRALSGTQDALKLERGERDAAAAEAQRLREALQRLVAMVPEPELVSMGYDSPPEHRTMEEHELGYSLHLAREALALSTRSDLMCVPDAVDARRYRWIRDHTKLRNRGYGPTGCWLEDGTDGLPWDESMLELPREQIIDAAIDAAMLAAAEADKEGKA